MLLEPFFLLLIVNTSLQIQFVCCFNTLLKFIQNYILFNAVTFLSVTSVFKYFVSPQPPDSWVWEYISIETFLLVQKWITKEHFSDKMWFSIWALNKKCFIVAFLLISLAEQPSLDINIQ